MSEKYKHRGNGRIYEIIRKDDFNDFSIKQDTCNEWENIIAYMDTHTHQPFITGEKRFKERFEKIE